MNDEMTQILTNEDFVGMSSSTFRESCEFSSNIALEVGFKLF